MRTAEIRKTFLDYFEKEDHKIVESSSLVPANDPSLLFTNAGMVQFKDVFLGLEEVDYKRATSAQRCVRAGGKHNDLDNVGYTARHHTFFEMLGNFSFGEYFKREAITFAWNFLTDTLSLPPDRLWITTYRDDDEATKIWLEEIGVAPKRLTRCGDKDNFWMMGNTGPCGPCSEIFFDHGEGVAGGPPGTSEAEGDRFVEIWNLVFMQYEKSENGELNPIPRPSVDTGMGLERIAAVLQGVTNNYDTDTFRTLVSALQNEAPQSSLDNASFRVIADHIRSSVFLINDGVQPSNEGRGYVLRRIIRRALRHGHKVGFEGLFFYKLVEVVVNEMGEAYPSLVQSKNTISQVLRKEEERFAETLDQGMHILEGGLEGLSGKVVPGTLAFQLYDTYGFPLDLTADVAREKGLSVDEQGFDQLMNQQRARARSASRFQSSSEASVSVDDLAKLSVEQSFRGYDIEQLNAEVAGLFVGGESKQVVTEGQQAVVILNSTPFYAEAGGQVGDRGIISTSAGTFTVARTQKLGMFHLHFGDAKEGSLTLGDSVNASVDIEERRVIRRNHSATHLLHAALSNILGEHILQKGSLVDSQRLRFDFTHPEPVSRSELFQIESLVNQKIVDNIDVTIDVLPYKEAVETGAVALFGEKYGEDVRVLSMGTFSKELCGGTHVNRTGDIGSFKIVSEGGIAAGVRRIEAVTGQQAMSKNFESEQILVNLSSLLGASQGNIEEKITHLIARTKEQDREIRKLREDAAGSANSDLGSRAVRIKGVNLIAEKIEGASAETLRKLCDELKTKLGHAVVVLATVDDGKVRLVAGVTKDLSININAGKIVNFVAEQVGGKGGGRPDMAQAGGTDPSGLDVALNSVGEWLTENVSD